MIVQSVEIPERERENREDREKREGTEREGRRKGGERKRERREGARDSTEVTRERERDWAAAPAPRSAPLTEDLNRSRDFRVEALARNSQLLIVPR